MYTSVHLRPKKFVSLRISSKFPRKLCIKDGHYRPFFIGKFYMHCAYNNGIKLKIALRLQGRLYVAQESRPKFQKFLLRIFMQRGTVHFIVDTSSAETRCTVGEKNTFSFGFHYENFFPFEIAFAISFFIFYIPSFLCYNIFLRLK